jgi:hypothetical protein
VVAIRSDTIKTGDQGGVAATLATSVKWGRAAGMALYGPASEGSGHPDSGWWETEGGIWRV